MRRLLHNLPVKLLSLLIAIILWYQLREREPIVQRSLYQNLQVVGLSPHEQAVGLPQKVLLRIQGPANLIQGTHLALTAYLDLSNLPEGPFTQPVHVGLPNGLQLIQVIPAQVIGTIEKIGRRVLPVVLSSSGEWVEGLPRVVEAQGPVSLLNQAALAFAYLAPGTTSGQLIPLNSQGVPISGLKLTPNQARVTSQGVQLGLRRLPIRLTPPPPQLKVLSERVPNEVTVVGPPEVLSDLKEIPASVNYRVGTYQAPLRLQLPLGILVVGEVIGTFQVIRVH
jgi:hypothetical protein